MGEDEAGMVGRGERGWDEGDLGMEIKFRRVGVRMAMKRIGRGGRAEDPSLGATITYA